MIYIELFRAIMIVIAAVTTLISLAFRKTWAQAKWAAFPQQAPMVGEKLPLHSMTHSGRFCQNVQ